MQCENQPLGEDILDSKTPPLLFAQLHGKELVDVAGDLMSERGPRENVGQDHIVDAIAYEVAPLSYGHSRRIGSRNGVGEAEGLC